MFARLRQSAALAAICAGLATAQSCGTCRNDSPEPIEHVEAPWTLKGTVYSILLLPVEGTLTGDLPVKAFPPLERQYPEAIQGDYAGVIGMIQVIQYTESPVGPYDELLLVPGFFNNEFRTADGETEKQMRVRVSRIYVSQKYTAWNGRTNWNIPKHLAQFNWTEEDDGTVGVRIYPFDTTGDPTESLPSAKPWFQFQFRSGLLDALNLPVSTDVYKLVGINATLLQPPLPHGNDAFGALAGTDRWKATVPGQYGEFSSLGTFDLAQHGGDAGADGKNAVGDEYFDHFWPGLGRYNVGLKMDDATITFGEPEVF